ncbi:MAG: hypothetical protein NC396_02565 [Bacteroides sp.]|nr:hypothetical protein [Bacteroides sp.]MCM1085074.1 hypothetical protein [Bacteroides sp.]
MKKKHWFLLGILIFAVQGVFAQIPCGIEDSLRACSTFRLTYESGGYRITVAKEAISMPEPGGCTVEAVSEPLQESGVSCATEVLQLLFVILVLFLVAVRIASYVAIIIMAKRRKRSSIGWLLASCFLKPLSIWIILSAIGRRNSKKTSVKSPGKASKK